VYNGSSWSDLPNAEREAYGEQPAYMIYDLSAGLSKDGRTWTLFINNVLDNTTRTYTYSQCTVSVCGVNPYYVPNVPRMIGLKLSQEF
jgi:outer membrane receptor protein involved in Fe transport